MNKKICDHCGKDINMFDHPAISGWFEFGQQRDKTAGLRWWQKSATREYHGEGCCWCNFDCFVKYFEKTFNRKFKGLYPVED